MVRERQTNEAGSTNPNDWTVTASMKFASPVSTAHPDGYEQISDVTVTLLMDSQEKGDYSFSATFVSGEPGNKTDSDYWEKESARYRAILRFDGQAPSVTKDFQCLAVDTVGLEGFRDVTYTVTEIYWTLDSAERGRYEYENE